MPVGATGAVLVSQRVGQIWREATNKVREEMQELGRKITQNKEQGVVKNIKGEGTGGGFKASKQKTERARSA